LSLLQRGTQVVISPGLQSKINLTINVKAEQNEMQLKVEIN